MNTLQLFQHRIDGSLKAIQWLRDSSAQVAAVADEIVNRIRNGGTVFTCGNGGSAAQAMHLAEELIGRYRGNRKPLPAVCLNADPTAITCIANDFGFDQVFARQCEALIKPGDVLIVLSTSGKSPNIVQALKAAKSRAGITIGLLGKDGGECASLCDDSLIVAAFDSAHIQDAHQVIIHLFCEAVEHAF